MKPEKSFSEPSMDEILSSIREIISTDPKKESKPLALSKDQEGILDLTDPLSEDLSHSSALNKVQKKEASMVEKKEDLSPFSSETSKPYSPTTKPKDAEPSSSTPAFDGHLVSQAAMSEAAQALHTLNKLAREKAKVPEPRLNDGIGGLTLEDLVRETLKPLLKEWLDKNLPTLVKWVVNEQVEKIVRKLDVTSHESSSFSSKTYDV